MTIQDRLNRAMADLAGKLDAMYRCAAAADRARQRDGNGHRIETLERAFRKARYAVRDAHFTVEMLEATIQNRRALSPEVAG